MNTQLWLLTTLLHALTALEFSDDTDCANISSTVTLNLNASHVVRTWQPSTAADCPWTETSPHRLLQVTNPVPAAVRSKPRWLVMQLRRPMLVERVRVQSWDGEWQTAGVDASRLSVFGAASLPLELQLEDPCRASLEAFVRFKNWRHIEREKVHTGMIYSYILANASENLATTDWSAICLSGKLLQLKIKTFEKSFLCRNTNFLKMRVSDVICFNVTTCEEGTINCSIESTNGSLVQISPVRSARVLTTQYFELKAAAWHHGASLICEVTGKPDTRVIETLGIIIEPESTRHAVPSVWVSGRNVSVEYGTNAAYPEPLHLCFINSSRSTWNMTKVSQNRKIFSSDSKHLTVITVKTQFRVTVLPSMLNGVLHCAASFGDSFHWSGKKLLDVTAISAPCVTEVDLSSNRHWPEGEIRQIRVTSRSCSIWNVTHNCWLINSGGRQLMQLTKTEQGNFTSTHQLNVTRQFDQGGWSVKCRVNQSGVVYDDVVIGLLLDRLTAFPYSTQIFAIMVAVLIICTLGHFVTWKIAWRRARAHLAVGQQRCRCGAMEMQPVNQAPAAPRMGATGADMSCPYDYPTVGAADHGNCTYEQPDEQGTTHGHEPVTTPGNIVPVYINWR